jgi:hypothetical protein
MSVNSDKKRQSEPIPTIRSTRIRRVVNRLIDELTPIRLATEVDEQFDLFNGIGRGTKYDRKIGYVPPQTEIDDYIAFDSITQHVLVKFKYTHAAAFTHREPSPQVMLEEEYQWYPYCALRLQFMEMRSGHELEAIVNNFEERIFELKNGQIPPHRQLPSHPPMEILWGLERKCILEFNFLFDIEMPFVGFIPQIGRVNDCSFGEHEMIIFKVRSVQFPVAVFGYGMTTLDSLEKSLKKMMTKGANDSDRLYALDLINTISDFVNNRRRLIGMVTTKYTGAQIDEADAAGTLLKITGGDLPLTDYGRQSAITQPMLQEYLRKLPRGMHYILPPFGVRTDSDSIYQPEADGSNVIKTINDILAFSDVADYYADQRRDELRGYPRRP